MSWVEPVAMLLVASYVLVRARLAAGWKPLLLRLGLLAIASWVGEQSVLRAYGFYHYAASWRMVLGEVPLAVVLIWPAVIHSAWDTSRCLLRLPLLDAASPAGAPGEGGARAALVPLVGAALVFADAWLIEPVSVQAGLWAWHEPGLLGVPPIGVLGWALHAGLCMAALERGARAKRPALRTAAMVLATPLGTHTLLLGAWWGALRSANVALPTMASVALAWVLSVALTIWALRVHARQRVPPALMWARVPPTLLFLALLGLHARHAPTLWAWAFAFAPPYLALTRAPGREGTPAC